MTQTLETLRESLAHYPPHARIEPPVEIEALRGGNELRFESEKDTEYVAELKEENEKLGKELEDAETELVKMRASLHQIREAIMENGKDYFQATSDVLTILDEGGY